MKSMTGMGRARGVVNGVALRIEIKSINHRYCEVSTRLPSRFYALDIQIQQHVKSSLSRGKIEVCLFDEKNTSLSESDTAALKQCFAYLQGVKTTLGLQDTVTLRDVIEGASSWTNRDLDPDLLWKDLKPVLDAALLDLGTMRSREGENLKREMQIQFDRIETLKKQITERRQDVAKELETKMRDRLQSKIKDTVELDPQRLAMEVVYYMDRLDITEEIHRLDSHFAQVRQFLDAKEPMGRKLDFLLQEFNREFNTIGSKSQNGEIAHWVVSAKADLEKIREQIQNVE